MFVFKTYSKILHSNTRKFWLQEELTDSIDQLRTNIEKLKSGRQDSDSRLNTEYLAAIENEK